MAAKKKQPLKYSYKPESKPVPKIQKLPVKQQIVHERKHRRHHLAEQSSDALTLEEKCAAVVITVLFFAALAYLFTQ